MVDQDPAHRFPRRVEEVRPVAPRRSLGTEQPEVDLVHQGRGPQGVIRSLAAQAGARQGAQLVLDQRKAPLERLLSIRAS